MTTFNSSTGTETFVLDDCESVIVEVVLIDSPLLPSIICCPVQTRTGTAAPSLMLGTVAVIFNNFRFLCSCCMEITMGQKNSNSETVCTHLPVYISRKKCRNDGAIHYKTLEFSFWQYSCFPGIDNSH